ncbi:fumarate hydratase C-terminal domain-containing protein [Candidatus Bathyarchaeota archaeon]|nr:fumarate hydratase C-terminal domain-containing protein [Candidatus Bathyarchaeota archaeon]
MATFHLKTPISENEIRKLSVKDILYLTGVIVTARDQAHKRILEHLSQGRSLPMNLEGLAIYHCGPVVKKKGGEWIVVAAGPTTSSRLEAYAASLIEKLGVRLIIGKGGMGEKTAEAMAEHGAAYGVFTGGAALLAAKAIRRVISVEWLDLGIPEAMWAFEVEHLGPIIVAIDSHGRNLFEEVMDSAWKKASLLDL